MKQFSPPKTNNPVGAMDEFALLGLDPNRYRSCSEPGTSNKGCAYADPQCDQQCEFPYKCKPASEGGGPHNHPVLIVSLDGSSNTVAMPCYHYMSLAKGHRDSGEIFEVVGVEGDTYFTKGTVEVVVEKPDGKKGIRVDDVLHDLPCPAFPRPDKNPLLAQEINNRKIVIQLQDRHRERRLAASLGLDAAEVAGHGPITTPTPATALDQELVARARELQRKSIEEGNTAIPRVAAVGEAEALAAAVATAGEKTQGEPDGGTDARAAARTPRKGTSS